MWNALCWQSTTTLKLHTKCKSACRSDKTILVLLQRWHCCHLRFLRCNILLMFWYSDHNNCGRESNTDDFNNLYLKWFFWKNTYVVCMLYRIAWIQINSQAHISYCAYVLSCLLRHPFAKMWYACTMPCIYSVFF